MNRPMFLLWFSVWLDWTGLVLSAWLVIHLHGYGPVLLHQPDALIFICGFAFFSWFFGVHTFLSWPWIPCRQLMQRWLFVICLSLVLAALVGWMSNAQSILLWNLRSPLLLISVLFLAWGWLSRSVLQPFARQQFNKRLARSLIAQSIVGPARCSQKDDFFQQRELLLLFVAYHPSSFEVNQLQTCLDALPQSVGYAVVVNDHHPGEPVEQLKADADCFLTNKDNPGYGRAVNRLVLRLGDLPPYVGVLNTDLSWQSGTFEQLLRWLQLHPQVSLAVPQILDEFGSPQKLCKNNPTVLGLMSRRFLPNWLKPRWLKRYDRWYVMEDQSYQEVFEAPYLSGCCMLIRSEAFRQVGGFDDRYFLYLEDADLTRSLSREGLCVHLPVAGVVHAWGRGNYRNLRLMAVNLISAWQYFRKWGWKIW